MDEIDFERRWRELAIGFAAHSSEMDSLRQRKLDGNISDKGYEDKLSDIGRLYGLELVEDTEKAFKIASRSIVEGNSDQT